MSHSDVLKEAGAAESARGHSKVTWGKPPFLSASRLPSALLLSGTQSGEALAKGSDNCSDDEETGRSSLPPRSQLDIDGHPDRNHSSHGCMAALRRLFLHSLLDLSESPAMTGEAYKLEFTDSLHYSVFRAFKFRDRNLEEHYYETQRLQETKQRIYLILLLYGAYLITLGISLAGMYHPNCTGDCYLFRITTWVCGFGFISLVFFALIFVCLVRRYEWRYRRIEGLRPEPADLGLPKHPTDDNIASPQRREPQLNDFIHIPISSQGPLPARSPWFMRLPLVVKVCCSENALISLMILTILNVFVWQLIVIVNVEEGSTRAMPQLIDLVVLAAIWCTTWAFLVGKSLYISAYKCFWIWLLQSATVAFPALYCIFGPPSLSLEEILLDFIVLLAITWGYIVRCQYEICSRMWHFTLWRVYPSDTDDQITDQGLFTTTGMENVLSLLSEIGRLAALASTSPAGTLRFKDSTTRILARVQEAQRMLVRYQDLFKVRVTARYDSVNAQVPLDFARMYGIDLGPQDTQVEVGSTCRTSMWRPGSLGMEVDLRRPLLEPTKNTACPKTDVVHEDAPTPQEIQNALRAMVNRPGVFEPSGGNSSDKRRFSRSRQWAKRSQRAIRKRMLWKRSRTQKDITSRMRAESDEGSGTTTQNLIRRRLHAPSARRISSNFSDSDGGASTGVYSNDIGGFRPEDLPKRQLTEELIGIVGTNWTIDLHKLDDRCHGNILVEVGYALIGRKISGLVQSHPELIDLDIMKSLESADQVNKAVYEKRSSLILQTMGTRADSLKATQPQNAPSEMHFSVLHHFVFMSFLYGLQQQYRHLPYHSAVHAAHVAHATASMSSYLGLPLGQSFSPAVEIAYVLASLGHDVGHPGRNNQFFVSTYDPLSVIYNDSSVLENYHCCLLFMTLELENCNVLFPFKTEIFRLVRELIIKLILATDMKGHFEYVSRFKLRRSDPEFDPHGNLEDLTLMLEMCIKCGDLASSACDWEVHRNWCFRVVEEFYRQGEQEHALGLPLSPLCDRSKHTTEFAKSQSGFIEFVVTPMMYELRMFDENNRQINSLAAVLQANSAKWQVLATCGNVDDLDVPLEIRECAKTGGIDLSGTPSTEFDGKKTKLRERYKKRRWTSIVGDLSGTTGLVPLVASASERDGFRRRRPRKRSDVDSEAWSLGEVKSTSSWDDDEVSQGVTHRRVRTVPLSQTPLARDLRAVSTRESTSSMPAYSISAYSLPSQESSHVESLNTRVGRNRMKRDRALSPSARVARWDEPRPVRMLDVIRRRASVLQPSEGHQC